MPALDTVVSDYLTAIKDALTTGTDTGSNMNAAAQNYLRAQDMASVLDLLQQALDATTPLTATGGSTTTIEDTSAFVAGTQVGNTVTIVGDAGAGSITIGETSVVVANDVTTLTVSPAFSSAVTASDTYTIAGTMLDAEVAALRDGKGPADATPGNPYGARKDAIAGLMLGVERLGGTIAERNIGDSALVALDGSTDTVVLLSGGPYRIDELRGMRVAVATAGDGIVLKNDENSLTLRRAMAASAAADDAVTITVPTNDFGGTSAPKIRTHPGAQPGENAVLADLIDQLQTLVVAFTIPT